MKECGVCFGLHPSCSSRCACLSFYICDECIVDYKHKYSPCLVCNKPIQSDRCDIAKEDDEMFGSRILARVCAEMCRRDAFEGGVNVFNMLKSDYEQLINIVAFEILDYKSEVIHMATRFTSRNLATQIIDDIDHYTSMHKPGIKAIFMQEFEKSIPSRKRNHNEDVVSLCCWTSAEGTNIKCTVNVLPKRKRCE